MRQCEEDGCERTRGYNPRRGAKVIAFAAGFLDTAAPLDGAMHASVTAYRIVDGALEAVTDSLRMELQSWGIEVSAFTGLRPRAIRANTTTPW